MFNAKFWIATIEIALLWGVVALFVLTSPGGAGRGGGGPNATSDNGRVVGLPSTVTATTTPVLTSSTR